MKAIIDRANVLRIQIRGGFVNSILHVRNGIHSNKKQLAQAAVRRDCHVAAFAMDGAESKLVASSL